MPTNNTTNIPENNILVASIADKPTITDDFCTTLIRKNIRSPNEILINQQSLDNLLIIG